MEEIELFLLRVGEGKIIDSQVPLGGNLFVFPGGLNTFLLVFLCSLCGKSATSGSLSVLLDDDDDYDDDDDDDD